MFRTIPLCFILLLSAAGVNGQVITWGEMNKSLNDKYSPEILRTDSNFIYTLTYDYINFYIEKFDVVKMRPVYSKKVIVPVLGMIKTELELISLVNDKFIVFYSFYNEIEKIAELRAYTIDVESGEGTGEALNLMKLPVENSRRAGEFSAITSEDGKRILINHYCYLRNQRMHQDTYVLFDDSLKIILNKTEKVEKGEVNYKTFNYQIDNNGSVYFIKMSDDGLFIASYDVMNNYEKWEERIDLSEHHPNTVLKSAYLGFNKNQDLILTGLYGLADKHQGLFFMQMDKFSKEITLNRFNEFNDSISELLNFTRPRDPKNMEYNNITLLHKEDGGMYLFCEQFKREIIYSQYSATCMSFFNDVALFDVSPEGEILKTFRIPKSQYDKSTISMFQSANRMLKKCEYLSILPWMDETYVYLAYNDKPENVPYINPRIIYSRLQIREIEKSVPVLISIDRETGEMNKNKFIQMENQEVIFKPQINYEVPKSNRLFIFAQRGLNYRFGHLVTQ